MRTTLLALIVFFAALLLSWVAHVFQPSAFPVAAQDSGEMKKTVAGGNHQGAVLDQVTVKHPRQKWQELSKSGGRLTLENIQQIASSWAAMDAREAAEFGLALTDAIQRGAFLREALTSWAIIDFKGFHDWLRAQSPKSRLARHLDLSRVGYNMRHPSLAAIQQVIALAPSGSALPDCIGHLAAKVWDDPAQRNTLRDWASTLADAAVKNAVWSEIAIDLAEDDPRAAAAMLPAITDARRSREASSTIAAHLALTQPSQALDYAASLTAPLAREAAWKSAFATWARREPAAALAHARDAASDVPLSWLEDADASWAKSMPVEAVQAVMFFPESRGNRESLASSILDEWKRENPVDATLWLSGERAAALLPESTRQRFLKSSSGNNGPRTRYGTFKGVRVKYTY
ncbi:MAG: hypothetical protein JNG86_03635 [Verrucomicrobiaceae bacterium]|nr:hypothetical protein [Verrucomicrobiaceae bacterium]